MSGGITDELVYGEVALGTSTYGPMTLVDTCRMPLVQVNTTLLVVIGLIKIGPRIGRRTATVKLQELMLPQSSRAVAMTVLVVFGRNNEPDGGEEVTVTLLHASVAMIDHVTMVAFESHVSTTMLLGHVIVGGTVSRLVTTCEQVIVLLQQSIICQIRVDNF